MVGRVAVYPNQENNKVMNFTRIDFIDNYEVSAALVETIMDMAREMGAEQIVGPVGGLMVKDFDQINEAYNYGYYLTHLERLGFATESEQDGRIRLAKSIV